MTQFPGIININSHALRYAKTWEPISLDGIASELSYQKRVSKCIIIIISQYSNAERINLWVGETTVSCLFVFNPQLWIGRGLKPKQCSTNCYLLSNKSNVHIHNIFTITGPLKVANFKRKQKNKFNLNAPKNVS